jgi:hypothetical protein
MVLIALVVLPGFSRAVELAVNRRLTHLAG